MKVRSMTKTKLPPVCRDAARADFICLRVEATAAGVWDPYDQGAWTWCVGMPRSDNPYIPGKCPPWQQNWLNWHEWNRGWDEEDQAHQPAR